MTLNQAAFATDTAIGTLTGHNLPAGTVIRQLAGVAQTTGTGTVLALFAKAPASRNQFSEVDLTSGTGTSTSVVARSSYSTTETQYLCRHNGTDLAISRMNSGTNTALANVAHTRAAGQRLRLTVADDVDGQGVATGTSTLIAYVNGTEVLRVTDATPLTQIGATGFRSSGTTGVQFDNHAGGDLAELGAVTPGADNMTSFVEVVPTPNADGLPRWRGLIPNLAGDRILLGGERLHRQSLDFWGLSGAWVPPAGWAVPAGAAALSSPAAGIGYLELATDGTNGGKARVECSVPIASTQHGAMLIEVNGLHFSALNPAADLRIGATDGATAGGGLTQLNGAVRSFLATNNEAYRTRCEKAFMGQDAIRRRPVGILISFATREVWLLERDRVYAYHDGLPAWFDGNLTAYVEITARAAAAVKLRMTSLTVTTYA